MRLWPSTKTIELSSYMEVYQPEQKHLKAGVHAIFKSPLKDQHNVKGYLQVSLKFWMLCLVAGNFGQLNLHTSKSKHLVTLQNTLRK